MELCDLLLDLGAHVEQARAVKADALTAAAERQINATARNYSLVYARELREGGIRRDPAERSRPVSAAGTDLPPARPGDAEARTHGLSCLPVSNRRRNRLHFLRRRKTAVRLLRIDEPVVNGDLEYAARALDQLDLGTVNPGEPVPHTEGFRFVSSNTAEFDPELHRSLSFRLPIRSGEHTGWPSHRPSSVSFRRVPGWNVHCRP